jgi:hypothetical protein
LLFYSAALPVSSKTQSFATGIIRRYCASIGSCWRMLKLAGPDPGGLACLCKDGTFAELVGGFGSGR